MKCRSCNAPDQRKADRAERFGMEERMSKTVLVVDDDVMNLRMAEFILSKADYKVLKANSGRKGIELLKQGGIDLTLLDIEMPEMNGIATLELIRQDEAIRESKVMILAASIDDGMKEKADRLGVAGYAGKPLMPAQLQAKVAEAFA